MLFIPLFSVFVAISLGKPAKKLHDLELTRTVCMQMAPQIRLIQNNNTLMSERIQSTIQNTIPLWKNQMVLRRLIMEAKDTEVKNLSMKICEIADCILRTWKEQAEDPSAICQFLNYYLPTFRSVLSKYRKMEALTLACKRDGLLDADAEENLERGAPT